MDMYTSEYIAFIGLHEHGFCMSGWSGMNKSSFSVQSQIQNLHLNQNPNNPSSVVHKALHTSDLTLYVPSMWLIQLSRVSAMHPSLPPPMHAVPALWKKILNWQSACGTIQTDHPGTKPVNYRPVPQATITAVPPILAFPYSGSPTECHGPWPHPPDKGIHAWLESVSASNLPAELISSTFWLNTNWICHNTRSKKLIWFASGHGAYHWEERRAHEIVTTGRIHAGWHVASVMRTVTSSVMSSKKWDAEQLAWLFGVCTSAIYVWMKSWKVVWGVYTAQLVHEEE